MEHLIKGTNKSGDVFLSFTGINDRNEVEFALWFTGDEFPFVTGSTPSFNSREIATHAIGVIAVGFSQTGVLPNFRECGELSPRPSVCRARAIDPETGEVAAAM